MVFLADLVLHGYSRGRRGPVYSSPKSPPEANRHRDPRRARRVLERTAARIMEYASGDADLQQTARALVNDVEVYAEREMSVMELKASFAAADYRVRDRAPSGRARKKGMP